MKAKLRLITNLFLFGEETDPNQQPPEPPEDDNKKYIDTINQLKRTTVPKEELDKLKEENKMLLDSIVNGGDLPPEIANKLAGNPEEPTIQVLREELFGANRKDLDNLEAATKMMKLRRLVIEETGEDPAISSLKSPTKEDAIMAEEAAQLIESCIEQADGDSAVFTALLQSHMVDDKLLSAASRQRMNKKRPI